MKLGRCLICGNRVKKDEIYVTAEEGYAHTGCIKRSSPSRGISV